MRELSRVIKFGGSLLESEALCQLPDWLAGQPPMVNFMVVGGGGMTDVVRQFDARHRLDESATHFLCIDAMSVTARLVAETLPSAQLLSDTESAFNQKINAEKIWIVHVRDFLRRHCDQAIVEQLPESWDVSSDSLAGVVSILMCATELVLLKSCLPDQSNDLAAWSCDGYVDKYFAQLVGQLPAVRCVNARGGFAEQ